MVRGQERQGGNTVCLEVLHPGSQRVILDAGTGLPNLGVQILRDTPSGGTVHLFLSHYHWDHVLGLPLFGPVYRPGFDIHLYGPHAENGALREMLDMIFAAAYSPIYGPENLLSNLIQPPESPSYAVDDLSISATHIDGLHPGGCQVLRVSYREQSFVYAPDVELRDASVIDEFVAVCAGCDMLVCGTAFSEDRFKRAVGWGHSSLEAAHGVAQRIGVKRFMGIHFDPLRTDAELEASRAARQAAHPAPIIELACEGEEVFLP